MIAELLELRENQCLRMPEELRSLLAGLLPSSILLPSPPQRMYIDASVGDTVTRTLLSRKQNPSIIVYDCAEKRKKTQCIEPPEHYRVIEAGNPRSCVSGQAIEALNQAAHLASRRQKVAVRINGEEDLLVLPLILLLPIGSLIVYGQPSRGVVVVKASPRAKKLSLRILEQFKKENIS